jgi:phosphotriesterase-related protein
MMARADDEGVAMAARTTTVETARGPIAADALGRVLAHEHVFVLSPEILQNYPEVWGDEDDRVADAVRRLTELKQSGIDTIIDPTALGLGRYIPRIARIAAQLELNIVCATGLYTFNELPHFFGRRTPGSGPGGSDPMVEMFVQDITQGMAGTGIKAGVIKCATDRPGVTPDVERVLRACAKTHRRTGVPITTHTNAALKRGLEQQAIFTEEGVDLERVVIGHCGDTGDLDYLLEIIGNGSILGMDRFGIDGYRTTADRVATVAELCKRGYADRMVLSHDCSCFLDWIPGELPLAASPNWNYLHISRDVLPMLAAAGVTDAHIDEMLVHTPKRFLTHTGPY